MSKYFHRTACILALGAITLTALAQTNGSNSPYSRYGYGLMSDRANAFNKGMAGTAYGMQNGTELNSKNPASYAAIDSLTFLFDLGVTLQNANISQSGTKTNAHNTSIDYITAGFRIAPRLGMAVGLTPISTIGYSMSTSTTLSNGTSGETTQSESYTGDGGLHEAFVGIGWAPIRQLAVGVNAGYLWGIMDHAYTSETSGFSRRKAFYTDIRSYKLDFGVQYTQKLDKKNSLTLGIVYGLGHDVNRTAYLYNQKLESSSVSQGDTTACHNAYALPHTLGVGLTWNWNNALRIGVDYTWEKWSNVKFPTEAGNGYTSQKGNFTDRHRINLGAEYIPNREGLHWRDRIRYRAGFSYSSPYARLGDGSKGPQSYLASLGAALPIINSYSNRTLLNISVEYEHVKPHAAAMITENYLRLTLGISFGERWFMKWKAE